MATVLNCTVKLRGNLITTILYPFPNNKKPSLQIVHFEEIVLILKGYLLRDGLVSHTSVFLQNN